MPVSSNAPPHQAASEDWDALEDARFLPKSGSPADIAAFTAATQIQKLRSTATESAITTAHRSVKAAKAAGDNLLQTYEEAKGAVQQIRRGESEGWIGLVLTATLAPVLGGAEIGTALLGGDKRPDISRATIDRDYLINENIAVPQKDWANYKKIIQMAENAADGAHSMATPSGKPKSVDIDFLKEPVGRRVIIAAADPKALADANKAQPFAQPFGRPSYIRQLPNQTQVFFPLRQGASLEDLPDKGAQIAGDLIADLHQAIGLNRKDSETTL